MSSVPPPDPTLAVLLHAAKGIPLLPDVVRARALLRARAIVEARIAWTDDAPITAAARPRCQRWRPYVSAMAALLLGTGIGGVAVAFSLARLRPQPASAPISDRPLAVVATAARTAAPVVDRKIATPVKAAPRLRQPGRTVTARESYAEEIELLEKAQAALARRDFGGALAQLAEHARRFPRGRLAEDREAMRVRLLASSGRPGDARRAEIAFADQFPRSVLLPHLREPSAAK